MFGGIAFLGAIGPGGAQNPATTISIDASANRHPISPLIYGTSLADGPTLLDLNIPVNRSGGNNTSRYNWLLNADNRASDWFFESIGYPDPTPGGVDDTFIAANKGVGAASMLTIPMIGWVARLGPNRSNLSSFSQAKYGAQLYSDYWFPDAGNGVLQSTGKKITGNDPNDASVPSDPMFQDGWMQHLVQTWGTAASGGLKYYIMDNEPSIWYGTHRDVHPTGPTMAEVRDKIIAYATRVKANDPTALVVGPEEWGWSGYLYSGYDQQYADLNGWSAPHPDRSANGNWDYLPWLLDQLHQHDLQTGQRLLDVFSVHYYPNGGEYSSDTSPFTERLRNRSTRSLWDPNYVDQSWINNTVRLIPRIKDWVAAYSPGAQTAITEYNWGAEASMNGATAQADVLGIFGREGLDIATRWLTPPATTPTYQSMKLYRNYDGSRSTFGDISVSAGAPNPDDLSVFAAQRSTDGALTVMVINKVLDGNTPVTLNVANFDAAGGVQVWQLASGSIKRLADTTVAGGSISLLAPAQSVTLLVLAAANAPLAPPTGLKASVGSGAAAVNWDSLPGATGYRLKRSTIGGGPYTVVATPASNGTIDTGLQDGTTYYYVVSAVGPQGESADSSPISVTPNAIPPPVPTNVQAAPGDTQVALTWDPSVTATHYNVKRSAVKGGPYTIITSPAINHFTDPGLTDGVTYYYVVSAVGEKGESANSAEVSAAPYLSDPDFDDVTTVDTSVVSPGGKVNITTTVTDTINSMDSGVVSLQVYDVNLKLAGSVFWEGESFTTGQSHTYKWTWTAPPAAGVYRVMLGVFNGIWTKNYDWDSAAAVVTVIGSAVTGFAPTGGPVGTAVQITGTGFTGATGVSFNGVQASFAVTSDSQITAAAPVGASSGPLSVTTPSGVGTSSTSFTVTAPTVLSFSPNGGPARTLVTITGAGFSGATGVKIGPANTSFTVNSDTGIVAIVPDGAAGGPIAVTTPAGTGVSATNFTVSPPSISSFSPASGPVGATVVITGASLIGVSGVSFGGVPANYGIDSASEITATVPSGAVTGPISVVSPSGTGTSASSFVVKPPALTSFTPTSGHIGSFVTLSGSSFTGASAVKFDGVSGNFFLASDSQIVAQAPPGFVSGPIGVTTPGGTVVSDQSFTILAPVLTNLSPDHGSLRSFVVITGTGFTSATSVQLNGADVNYYINLDTQIVAFVPDQGSSGALTVTTPSGTSNALPFTVNAPTITALSPTSGSIGSSVTISGSGFTLASAVKFGGVNAAGFFIATDGEVIATVPTGFVSGLVSVTGPLGTGISADAFTVSPPQITSFTPGAGAPGTAVILVGSHFTGATSVSFNGVPALYFLANDNEIIATVPNGATTGPITVTTPGGVGAGNVDFQVQ